MGKLAGEKNYGIHERDGGHDYFSDVKYISISYNRVHLWKVRSLFFLDRFHINNKMLKEIKTQPARQIQHGGYCGLTIVPQPFAREWLREK